MFGFESGNWQRPGPGPDDWRGLAGPYWVTFKKKKRFPLVESCYINNLFSRWGSVHSMHLCFFFFAHTFRIICKAPVQRWRWAVLMAAPLWSPETGWAPNRHLEMLENRIFYSKKKKKMFVSSSWRSMASLVLRFTPTVPSRCLAALWRWVCLTAQRRLTWIPRNHGVVVVLQGKRRKVKLHEEAAVCHHVLLVLKSSAHLEQQAWPPADSHLRSAFFCWPLLSRCQVVFVQKEALLRQQEVQTDTLLLSDLQEQLGSVLQQSRSQEHIVATAQVCPRFIWKAKFFRGKNVFKQDTWLL